MKYKTVLFITLAFVIGLILGWYACTLIKPINTKVVDINTTNTVENNVQSSSQETSLPINNTGLEESNRELLEEVPEEISKDVEVINEEIVEPKIRGMFSWHKFKEKYLPIMETYNIDQLYQCFDSQIREGNYDAIRESLSMVSDYDVWLLTGDSSWDAEDMLKKVDVAQEIGGFKGVVFDVEPDDYDETYLNNVKLVCEQSELPVMFCVSYRADVSILKEVISVADGLLVMNYDVGNEYANIKELIPVSEQYDVPLITVYELQPSNHDIGLHSYHTYNGDMQAVKDNFEEQFKGEDNIGIAYHYIKYVNTD